MSVSNLEVLQNAQMNLETFVRMNPMVARHPIFMMATEQVKNGVAALKSGKDINDTYIED